MRLLILTRLKKNLEFTKNLKSIIILLGPWCLPKGKLYTSEKIIKMKWDHPNQRKDDFEEIWRLKNIILKKVIPVLNSIHKTNLNINQWNLIIGYWLYFLITVSFERLNRIKKAQNIVDFFISEKNFNLKKNIYDINSFESIKGLQTDEWNSLFIETLIEDLNLIKPYKSDSKLQAIFKKTKNNFFMKKKLIVFRNSAFFFFKKFIEYLSLLKAKIANYESVFLVYKPSLNYLDF